MSEHGRTPPNVIWLMTDEQRCDSLGVYGSPWARTPNLDRIASEGTVFENAYTPAPICMPARASILTGQYPSGTTVWTNTGQHSVKLKHLLHLFTRAGYRTATFGKQHYGGPVRAFQMEKDLVIPQAVSCYDYQPPYDGKAFDAVLYPGRWVLGGVFPEPVCNTPEFQAAEAARKWLSSLDGETPFFLRLSFSAPHTPVTVPREFAHRIGQSDLREFPDVRPAGKNRPVWIQRQIDQRGANRLTEEQLLKARQYYYSETVFTDDLFGKFLQWLEDNHYLDNTIIVFSSDHGTHLGDYSLVQKMTFYEPVVRVPYFIRYPGCIPAGVRLRTPVETRSLLPTLLGLCGIESSGDAVENSLAACLLDAREPEVKPVFSEVSCDFFDRMTPDRRLVMVRLGRWKLSRCADSVPGDGELYNLESDPLEEHNLYLDGNFTEIRKSLEKQIGLHLADTPPISFEVLQVPAVDIASSGEVLCPTCSEARIYRFSEGRRPSWAGGEGEPFYCDHCGQRFIKR